MTVSRRAATGLLLLLGVLVVPSAAAQELSCRVQVDKSQLSGSDFDFLDNLERRVEEYMNTNNWTEDRYLPHERIRCSMQIVMEESITLSTFNAQLVLSSWRPIHGTSQSTVLLRVNDSDWRFQFNRGTPLEFDPDRHDALTSVLDFYAYMILGYDSDTFSELGGTSYFERARSIADRANPTGEPGWSSSIGTQNRMQLVTELLQKRHRPLRRAMYLYHMHGLDQFVKNPSQAREEVLGALELIQEVHSSLSRSYALDLFFTTKADELAAIFAGGDRSTEAYRLLTEIDPSRTSDYDAIVQ